MSEPPPPQPDSRIARAPRSGGSVVLGIVAGVVFIGVFVGLAFLLAANVPAVSGYLLWLPPLVCLVAGIVLTVLPRTTRFGAGLLIGFGIALLASAGVCVAIITGIGH
jgi:hypothetical protein